MDPLRLCLLGQVLYLRLVVGVLYIVECEYWVYLRGVYWLCWIDGIVWGCGLDWVCGTFFTMYGVLYVFTTWWRGGWCVTGVVMFSGLGNNMNGDALYYRFTRFLMTGGRGITILSTSLSRGVCGLHRQRLTGIGSTIGP